MLARNTSKQTAGELIDKSLRGDIMDIFYSVVPELSRFDRGNGYEVVIGNPSLLSQCFLLFRAQPQLFSKVVVDRQNRPVTDDAAMLKCGMELAEVIAMVVRASAKRYFRATIGGPIREALPPHPQPTWKKLASGIGLCKSAPARYKVYPGPGDTLFQAIRQYLRFDWQSGLITDYASLSPKVVKRIGPFLGEIREPVELRAVARDEGFAAADMPGRMPLLLDNATRLLRADGAIDEELLWSAFVQMDLRRLFSSTEEPDHRQACAFVAQTSKHTISLLIKALDGNLRAFVCFLFVAYSTLCKETYRKNIAGEEAITTYEEGLVQRIMSARPLPAPSLAKMKVYSLKVLS